MPARVAATAWVAAIPKAAGMAHYTAAAAVDATKQASDYIATTDPSGAGQWAKLAWTREDPRVEGRITEPGVTPGPC